MIYLAAPDGFLLAIDAKDGKLRWETKVDNGGHTAGGMLVADGKVITGRTCPQGVRTFCFISAMMPRPARNSGSSIQRPARRACGDTWANMPVDQRAAGPWGLPGRTIPSAR